MPIGLLSTDGKDSSSSTAGSSTVSVTIPRTLYSNIMAAVRKNLVLRSLAAMVVGPSGVPGSSLDFALQTPESMEVSVVGEGAEIPFNNEEYSGFNVKPLKYGVRIPITKEAMEDSNFDLMQLNIDTAAYELADNEEALIVAQLNAAAAAAAGTAHEVANSNATLPVTDITAAMQYLEADNYTPTHMIVGATVANDLRNIDEFNNSEYGSGSINNRLIGNIFGMKVIMSNNVPTLLAYVIDASKAFMIVEKRPITVVRYDDPSRDTSFAVITQRVAVRYIRAEAVAEITTT